MKSPLSWFSALCLSTALFAQQIDIGPPSGGLSTSTVENCICTARAAGHRSLF